LRARDLKGETADQFSPFKETYKDALLFQLTVLVLFILQPPFPTSQVLLVLTFKS